MEASAIFIISQIHGARAGGVMHMMGQGADTDPERALLLSTAVESLRVLIEQDKAGAVWP
jgi:hypothetical protein